MLTSAMLILMTSSASGFPEVSKENLKATLEHLSTYTTRNTNTDECEQAVRAMADRFRAIPGLEVEVMPYEVKAGRRIVKDRTVYQVVATLKGTSDKRIIIGGHLDTINLSGDPMTVKAPGINDDGSGVALTLECARLLAQGKWRNTLVFVAFTGEEQGLFGSAALAARAKSEKWTIEAMLNNDTVGSSSAKGIKDKKRVRLYSEEVETHNSREAARFIEWNARGKVKGVSPWLVFRRDRFQRGGDHTPFNREGFNALRFVEAVERLDVQHTDKDLIENIDFDYLAGVTALNAHTLRTLANADDAPTNVAYDPKQAHDTTLRWKSKPGVQYRVYWRESSSSVWQGSELAGAVETFTVKKKNKDDHVFAVGAEGGVPVSAG